MVIGYAYSCAPSPGARLNARQRARRAPAPDFTRSRQCNTYFSDGLRPSGPATPAAAITPTSARLAAALESARNKYPSDYDLRRVARS
ncbi:hypothetical protein EVAR_8356_1 [Eumeta japonica]|uniref:Uncharacterized protein n=1 Tax=Eumeta variegata TaxID=151549 RepID=A0A4C1VD10_EUMVA|nr:hypothetical protein EVAR_8356_1 [Eumeta japonica]